MFGTVNPKSIDRNPFKVNIPLNNLLTQTNLNYKNKMSSLSPRGSDFRGQNPYKNLSNHS